MGSGTTGRVCDRLERSFVGYNLKEFQLILDIEGEEVNVIKNNNQWMDNCNCILLENHLPKVRLEELNNYIINKGFRIIQKKENVFLFKKY